MGKEQEQKTDIPTSLELKRQLADDDLNAVLEGLILINKQHESPSYADDLTLLNARWKGWKEQYHDGTADFDKLNISKTQIRKAALALINQLPSGANSQSVPKPQGILESRFKKQLFWFMLIAKLFIIAFIWFHQSTGGFNKYEALASTGLLLPVFTAYITAMINDAIGDKYVDTLRQVQKRYLKRNLQVLAYTMIPLYILFLVLIINAKPRGTIDFEQMNSLLALVESGFGVYVGKIIFSVFGKEE